MDIVDVGILLINSFYSMIIIQITINSLLRMAGFSGDYSRVLFLNNDLAKNNCFV